MDLQQDTRDNVSSAPPPTTKATLSLLFASRSSPMTLVTTLSTLITNPLLVPNVWLSNLSRKTLLFNYHSTLLSKKVTNSEATLLTSFINFKVLFYPNNLSSNLKLARMFTHLIIPPLISINCLSLLFLEVSSKVTTVDQILINNNQSPIISSFKQVMGVM